MKKSVNKIWKDPVFSNIFAVVIISVFSLIYTTIKSRLNDTIVIKEFEKLLNLQIEIKYIAVGIITITIVRLLFRFVKSKIKNSYSDIEMNSDKKLFSEIKDNILPSYGSIDFIRKHDFAGSFLNEHLKNLHNFYSNIDKPEFEFIDKTLDKYLSNLKNNITIFLITIGYNTFNIHSSNVDANSVPKEWLKKNPDKFHKVVAKLHETANEICTNYDDLIKTSRRKLGD